MFNLFNTTFTVHFHPDINCLHKKNQILHKREEKRKKKHSKIYVCKMKQVKTFLGISFSFGLPQAEKNSLRLCRNPICVRQQTKPRKMFVSWKERT